MKTKPSINTTLLSIKQKFKNCHIKNALIILLVALCFPTIVQSQINNNTNDAEPWNAQWITGPGISINSWTASRDPSLKEYGVFKFRKTLELEHVPTSFVVHLSGDNRYKLYVNGELTSQGPARGDLYFWNYETVDLAPFLKKGNNLIAAVVWNDGPVKPEAQITHLTGFILQGDTKIEEVINTNDSWKTIEDESYEPLPVRVGGYYVAGPGELVDMSINIQGWEKLDYNDKQWVQARVMGTGNLKQFAVNSSGWMLVPSPIPQMEMTKERLASTRLSSGVVVPKSFPAEKADFSIPANSEATLYWTKVI